MTREEWAKANYQGMRGGVMQKCMAQWPNYNFASGISSTTNRYSLFVYAQPRRGTSIPLLGQEPMFELEFCGYAEKDIEVFMAKLALVLG